MTSESQKSVGTNQLTAMRRVVAAFLVGLIVLVDPSIAVLAEEIAPVVSQFLQSDVLTSEIEKLTEVRPELSENFSDQRKEKIQAANSESTKWTERIVLGKLENGAALDEVVGQRKDAEKVVADLKAVGAISTMADAQTGTETEIDPTLQKSSGGILKTSATPYRGEFSVDSAEPLIIAENLAAAGDVVSTKTSDKQVAADATPQTREEVRYFNWNANPVKGNYDSNKLLYPDLWGATDLLVTTGETGTKEDLILKNALAPTNFEYIVETIGLKLQTTADGGYVFVDESGNEKFYTPAPNLTDANGQSADGAIHYELGWDTQKPAATTTETTAQVAVPLAEIKFNEDAGTKFFAEKSSTTGTIFGATWLSSGVSGNALSLDDGQCSAEIARDFKTPQTITLSTWVQPSAYQDGVIAGFGNNTFRQTEKNGFGVTLRIGDKNFVVDSGVSAFELKKWYHLVATFDGTVIRFFIDGVETNSLALKEAGTLAASDAPILFGGNFAGAVDEFAIFDHALSADEIGTLHQKYLDEKQVGTKTSTDQAEIKVIEESELNAGTEIKVIEENSSNGEISVKNATEVNTEKNSNTVIPETEIPAKENAVVAPAENIPTEQNSGTVVPATETPAAQTDENPAPTGETSFIESLKKFFLPSALAEISQFDQAVSIDQILNSNEAASVDQTPAETTPVETPVVEATPEIGTSNNSAQSEPTVAPDSTTVDEAIPATENPTALTPVESTNSTNTQIDSSNNGGGDTVTSPANEIQVVEESALAPEIKVIEESEVNKFFAPEAVSNEHIKIAADAEITVLTEQQLFAQSNQISEEDERSDGAIVRRYKLRLVIDTAAPQTKNTETIDSSKEATPEPATTDSSVEVVAPTEETSAAEEVTVEPTPPSEVPIPETENQVIQDVTKNPSEEIKVIDEVTPSEAVTVEPESVQSEVPAAEPAAEVKTGAANLSADVLQSVEVAAATEVDLDALPKTLTLANGMELTFPIDVDPSTYVTLVNRGARTFAPNFAQGNQNGEYSQTNVAGSISLGTEDVSGERISAVSSQISVIDANGAEFLGDAVTDSQNWTKSNDSLRSNTIGSKIKFTTAAATEIFAGLNFSPAGGVLRVTIDRGTDHEISNEIDTFATASADSQKVLLATGLRNSAHDVELELTAKTNSRFDSSAAANFRFALAYFEAHASGFEIAGTGIDSTADSGSTTTLTAAALTQPDDFWNGAALTFTSGPNAGEVVFVTDFASGNHKLTFTPAVGTAVTTENFQLSPDGILINGRAERGLNFHAAGAEVATFESLDNFPTNPDGTVKKGSLSIWLAPDFAADADTAKHFIFDNGLARLYFDGADDKFKFEMWDGDDFTTVKVASAEQTFVAHESLHLTASFDAEAGVKLFVNGVKTFQSLKWTAQPLTAGDAQITFGKCGTRSAAALTAAETYFAGTLAEPQIWNYVLLDSEIFGLFNSTIPSVGQAHTQKIEASATSESSLLFNAPLVNSANDRLGSLAGAAKLDASKVGSVTDLEFNGDPLGQLSGIVNSQDLAGFWKMDGDFTDSSFAASDAAANGGTTFIDGHFAKAAIFDGSDDYLNIGAISQPVNAVSFWIFADNVSRDIIDFDGGTHALSIVSRQLIATGFDSPTIFVDGTEGTEISRNAWHHIVVTTATSFTASDLKIGKKTTFFDGKIDELALFARPLTAAEVAAIYTSADNSPIAKTSVATEIIAGLDIGPNRGITQITIDGGTPSEITTEVDTFAASAARDQRFLVATNLVAKEHTVRIENSGLKNLSATAALIVPQFIETNSTSSIPSNALTMNSRIIDDVISPDFVQFPHGLTFPDKGNISEVQNTGTLEFWATGALMDSDHFVDTRDDSGNNGARIYMDSASALTFEFKNASAAISITDSDFAENYSATAANHILARWWQPTATTFGLSLYLNGQKIAEKIAQNFTPSQHSQIILGNDATPDATAAFTGSIFDFAIYADAFTDGGAALGSFATPDSQVWLAANSRATKTEQILGTKIDTDTNINFTDGAKTTFPLERGALKSKVLPAKNYAPTNRDTDFGTNANAALAQEFRLAADGAIPSVGLWLKKVGTPTGNIALSIQTDADGLPSGTTVANGTAVSFAVDALSTRDYEWVNFNFATPPSLTAGTAYHLVLEGTFKSSASNYIVWAADASAPSFADGTAEIKGAEWAESAADFIFQIYESYPLANSVEAYVDGVAVAVTSAQAGSFARIDSPEGISAAATSFRVDSISAADQIPSSGFLWLGNPSAQFKREKVYFGEYSGGTFSNLKRGIDGTVAGDFGDQTIVEIAGAVTLAQAPAKNSDLFVKYNFAGDAVERDSSDSESSIFFLDEANDVATGWAKIGTDSDRSTALVGQTAFAKLRGTEISAVLDQALDNGGVTQFVLDEGTRTEKSLLVDASKTTETDKIKSLATGLTDALHTLRIVANIAAGKNSTASARTWISAFLANGHTPLFAPSASSTIAYANPLADLNPETIPDNPIDLEKTPGGNDSYTKLLIQSGAADGSTIFADASLSAHTITVNGDTHYTTAAKKFGATSLRFDGAGDSLALADSTDWDFGDANFTIDGWINLSAATQGASIIAHRTVDGFNGFSLIVTAENKLQFIADDDNSAAWAINFTSTDVLPINEWSHFALVRNGADFEFYINGSASGSTQSDISIYNDKVALTIGGEENNYFFNGYLDELRISKGIARWTKDFTPPTEAYDAVPTEGPAIDQINIDADANYILANFKDTSATEGLANITRDDLKRIKIREAKVSDLPAVVELYNKGLKKGVWCDLPHKTSNWEILKGYQAFVDKYGTENIYIRVLDLDGKMVAVTMGLAYQGKAIGQFTFLNVDISEKLWSEIMVKITTVLFELARDRDLDKVEVNIQRGVWMEGFMLDVLKAKRVSETVLEFDRDAILSRTWTEADYAYDNDAVKIKEAKNAAEEAAKNNPPRADKETRKLIKRTANTDIYDNGDGTKEALIYAAPENIQIDGEWEKVDDYLGQPETIAQDKAKAGKQYQIKPYDIFVGSDVENKNIIKYVKDGKEFSFSLENIAYQDPNRTIVLANAQAGDIMHSYKSTKFRNIFPGVDLKYHSTKNGVKEELFFNNLDVLKEVSEPDHFKGKVILRTKISVPEGVTPEMHNDQIFFKQDGQNIFSTSQPFIYDQVQRTYQVGSELKNEQGNYYLEITLDYGWMASDDGAFPLVLDPDFNVVQAPDVSLCSESTCATNNSTGRAYLKFDISGIPADKRIISANLTLTHAANMATAINARRFINQTWNEASAVSVFTGGSYGSVLSTITSGAGTTETWNVLGSSTDGLVKDYTDRNTYYSVYLDNGVAFTPTYVNNGTTLIMNYANDGKAVATDTYHSREGTTPPILRVAYYSNVSYDVNYTAGANGTITGTLSQTVNEGASGTAVTAVPSAGYYFAGWSDGSTQNPRTDTTVLGNISVTASFAPIASSRRLPLAYTVHTYGSLAAGRTFQSLAAWEDMTDINLSAVTTTDQDSSGNILYVADTTVFNTCVLNESTVSVAGQILTITGVTPGVSLTVSNISGTIPSGTALKTGFVLTAYADAAPYNDIINFTGATTDSNYYRVLRAASGQRGTPTSGVRFAETLSPTGIYINENYSSVYGVAVSVSYANAYIYGFYNSGSYNIFSGCTAYDFSGATDSSSGFTAGPISYYAKFINCLAYNIDSPVHDYGGFNVFKDTAGNNVNYFYNCTAVGCSKAGFFSAGQNVSNPVMVTKNCISQSNGSTFYGIYGGVIEQTTNATTGVVFAADGYHLDPTDTVAKNNGTDLSTDSAFKFGEDIDGESRYGWDNDWDIGADEYTANAVTLNYSARANGTISGKNTQTLTSGGNATAVTAVPNAHFHFTSWSDGVLTAVRTDSNVTSNASYVANFELDSYSLSYAAGSHGSLTGTTSQTVLSGVSGTTVTAVPDAGYGFSRWSDGVLVNPRTDTNVLANVSVTANFELASDIVAVTAGASSSDRTSLTSGTWFNPAAIGGDDDASFGWTDPNSTSDDTFYYALNSTAADSAGFGSFSAWSARKSITIDRTKISSTITNFPVYVNLADLGTDFFAAVKTDGSDIRLTNAAGTELPYELVSINTTAKTGELYFKADSLSATSNTTFYIYYGNAAATAYAVTATYGRNNVWDTNYKMVQHMNDATTSTTTDSTVNANTGTKAAAGNPLKAAAGKIGEAQSFDGTDDYINIGTSSNFNFVNGDFVISMWVNPEATRSGSGDILLSRGTYNTDGYYIQIAGSSTNSVVIVFSQSGAHQTISSTASIQSNQWNNIIFVRQGSVAKWYINGQDATVGTPSFSSPASSTRNLYIGRYDSVGYTFNGSIDEVKVWSRALSAAEIAAEYANQNSPATFYSVGSAGTTATPYLDSVALSEGTSYFHVRPKTGAGVWGTERTFTLKYDKSGPVGGSVTHSDSAQISTTIPVTVSRGTDALSGLSTTDSDYLLEYRSADLTPAGCGAYSAWTDTGATETAAATTYSVTAPAGKCYQFRYTVKDTVGNSTILTSANTTKVETTPDIVAVTAGASSSDRTSLTSGQWFNPAAIGSDDAASFAWTDPNSLSDDSFYYDYTDSSLVSWWKMDGDWTDSAGTNTGTAANGATFTASGKISSAGSFDGVNDYVAKTALSTSFSSDLTLSTWVKSSSNPVSQQRIIDLAQASGVGLQLCLFATTGTLGIDNSGGPTTSVVTSSSKADGLWHQAVITRSSTNYYLYVDGAYVGTVSGTAPSYTRIFIGESAASASYFSGSIDEVKIWNRALSAAEIAAEYARGTPTTNAYADNISLSEGTSYLHVRPQTGSGVWGTERIFTVKYDKTAPAGGSVTHLNGVQASTTVAVTVSRGTDAGSGLSTTDSDYTLRYRSAVLTAGTCAAFAGDWLDTGATETAATTTYNVTVPTGYCYQFSYTVKDAVGNEATFTSASVTKISSHTLTYTAGTGGSITGTSPQTVAEGTSGTAVTAVPSTGYYFVGWSDGVTTAARTDANVVADISVSAVFRSTVSARRLPLAYTVHTYGSLAAGRTFQSLAAWEDLTTVNLSAVTTTDQDSSGNTLYIADTTVFDNAVLNESTVSVAGQILTITGVTPGVSLTVSNISGTIPSGTALKTGFVLTAYADAAPYDDSVLMAGATTSSSFYRVIRAATGQRGTPTSGVRFEKVAATAWAGGLAIGENYSAIFDIASKVTSTGAGVHVYGFLAASVSNTKFVGCTAYDVTTSATDAQATGFMFQNLLVPAITQYAINCVAKNTSSGRVSSTQDGSGFSVISYGTGYGNETAYLYNCSSVSNRNGVATYQGSGTATTVYAKNCIAQSNTLANFQTSNGGTINQTTNATSGVTFIADGYHLAYNDAVAKDHGTNLSGISPSTETVFPFSDDLDKDTRTGTWDIGADEYIPPTYTLTYTAGAGGSITGTSPQTVAEGASGTAVTAVPNAGYQFVNWSDSSTQNPRTDTTVVANKSVTANFELIPDIAPLDAGASSSDRTSLTSDTWFNYAAAGSDDAVSFSWADPNSASDDSFYYDLNTTSTNTFDNLNSLPTTGLVSWWKMDGDWTDSAGTNTGTAAGGATFTTSGKIASAGSFDGVDDYVNLTGVNTLEGLNAGTISVWFKGTSVGNLYGISNSSTATDFVSLLVGASTSSYTDESLTFVLWRTNVEKLAMFVRKGESYYLDNNWHHVVVKTGDGANAIYVDGVSQPITYRVGSATTNEFSNIDSQNAARIGNRIYSSTNTSFFTGSIDEVKIFNRALTAAEIGAEYQRRLTTTNNFVDTIPVSEGTSYLHVRPKTGAGAWGTERIFTVKYDKTAPTGGSVAHSDSVQNTTTIPVTVSRGTDALSGLSTTDSDYLLEYRSAALSPAGCGTYGDWLDTGATETAAATTYNVTAPTGNCYQFQYIVKDAVGNEATYTSANTTKVEAVPDIVAVDAGASSSDRVSLTSDIWFGAAAIGGDDQASFGWTDPNSASDDAFYYALNATSSDSLVSSAPVTSTTDFSYTGTIQSYTVPAGVTSITITAKGAGGGTNGYSGGAGGSSTGTLSVTPGATYYILVGRTGSGTTGGYGGGGNGGSSGANLGAGGGGMTWFSPAQSFAQNTVLLVAGGGGGGGVSAAAGSGGGITGGVGTGVGHGGAGTQNAGGAAGANTYASGMTAGSAGQGGTGGTYSTYGGGGGGGYYGGGGGGVNMVDYDAGGGGSGYLSASLTEASTTLGAGAAAATNGSLTITTYASASVTTPYLDSVALSEGTSYLHVRPQTGSGVWGTERIFTVKYDKTAPTVSADKASATWYTTNQTITLSASDATAGLATARYVWDTNTLAADCSSGGTTFTNATQIPLSTNGTHTLYLCAADTAANVATWNGAYKLDSATPDIAPLDAGASSSDRTSLTSGTWFNYAAAGNDDAASFSWIDPNSASDDTFYYDLNTTSTNTFDNLNSLPTTGLVSWWKMDGDWTDSAGTNTGTAANGATFTTSGRISSAGSFDGVNDYVSSASVTSIPSGRSARTLSAWINPSNANPGGVVMALNDSDASGQSFILNAATISGTSYLFTDGKNSTNNITITGDQVPVAGQWSLMNFVFDGVSGWQYYLNGVLKKSGSFAVTINTTADNISIGRRGDATNTGYYFPGSIDEVKIFNRALTAAEIGAEYQRRLTTTNNFVDTIPVSEGTSYLHVRPQTGSGVWGTERIFTVKYDKTAPTVQTNTLTSPNGGEAWTGGSAATYPITWDSTDFTDAGSGLAANPITLAYSTDSGATWTTIATGEANDGTYSWTTPALADAGMRIRVSATDLVGNTASDTSDADFNLSVSASLNTLHIVEGNNQLGGIDETLPTELKVRVGNGAVSNEVFAGAGEKEVTFTLYSVPESPTAVGQVLTDASFGTTFGGTEIVKTVTTDADGYASVALTLGDRAGDYTVVADFDGCETLVADRTFTATEREVFQFTLTPANLNLDLDPSVSTGDSAVTTIAVTTNAASFAIGATPHSWLTLATDTIANWNGTTGLGWDNANSGTTGGTATTTAFTGLVSPTPVFTCAGTACQGTQNFTLNLHSAVDYSTGAGNYESNLELSGVSVEF